MCQPGQFPTTLKALNLLTEMLYNTFLVMASTHRAGVQCKNATRDMQISIILNHF